jgi:REP element-mobilizing transposase RayT
MPDKFLNKYRIQSARLSNWDYSSNATYFLTICTADRQHYFGEVVNSEMQLSKIGEYARECWINIPNHFAYFYLDESVIMPNHLHGIVLIEKPYIDNSRGFGIVETRHALSQPQTNMTESERLEFQTPHFRFRNQGKNTISSMVGSFKSAVTKFCNENKLTFQWQSRFHDHIIRDKDEYCQIRNYIVNNPSNWKDDRFYSL